MDGELCAKFLALMACGFCSVEFLDDLGFSGHGICQCMISAHIRLILQTGCLICAMYGPKRAPTTADTGISQLCRFFAHGNRLEMQFCGEDPVAWHKQWKANASRGRVILQLSLTVHRRKTQDWKMALSEVVTARLPNLVCAAARQG